ncbi:TPA: hypothetical protein ACW7U9_004727 [Citrobacter freundii]|nr:hypothetical protein [Citrobacter werkmanii]
MIDFDDEAYGDTFDIHGEKVRGNRNGGKRLVEIPYTEELDINIGDIIVQLIGSREIQLKVIDISLSKNGTLFIGTEHPHLMNLKVENLTEQMHSTRSPVSSTYNISSINATQVQVGNNNSQIANITMQELIERVSKSEDPEAKATLRTLLENSTVASIVGAGASALLGLL